MPTVYPVDCRTPRPRRSPLVHAPSVRRMSRVLLAGNNEAACLVLDLLLEALPERDVLAVVPPGGVHHAWQPSLERHAAARGVPVLAPLDVNDDATLAAVAGHRAE